MKTTGIATTSFFLTAALAGVVQRDTASIAPLPEKIQGLDKSGFPNAPSNLKAETKQFLEKYQKYSDKAVKSINPASGDKFASNGICYSEYPCFSVQKSAVGTIGNSEEVSQKQVSALLDQVLSSDTVTYDNENGPAPFTGQQWTAEGATLSVIAPGGTAPSDVVAGLVFDLFKLQTEDATTNSIRAVKALGDGEQRPTVALCLHPADADAQKAYNFCIGKQLDGSYMPTETDNNNKRDVGDIADFICNLIDIPILC